MRSEFFHENGAEGFPEKTYIWKNYQGCFRDDHLILTQNHGRCNCFSQRSWLSN